MYESARQHVHFRLCCSTQVSGSLQAEQAVLDNQCQINPGHGGRQIVTELSEGAFLGSDIEGQIQQGTSYTRLARSFSP